MSVLAIEGLTLTCRVGTRQVEVLRDISLSVDKGQVLGLVGESGAGKSMIGRVIAGLLPAGFTVSRGTIRFDGSDLRALERAAWRALLGRRIAFIPQEPLTALDPVQSIGQTFDEHLMLLGIPPGDRAERAQAALASVKLPTPRELLRRYPHQLSGGQCQRVLIAMAFVANPALIVADEPTTALDVVSQAHILSLLEEQRAAHGTALLLITHDLRLAAHVCDQVAVLYAGELAEIGPARQVLGHSRHPYTWALQHATPDVRGPQRTLPVLSGHMPGVESLPGFGGCRFAARCPRREDACELAPQPLEERAAGHRVRCLKPVGGAAAHALPAGPGFVPPAGDRDAGPLLELRDVGLRYTARHGLLGQRRFHTMAVDGVSFQVRPGEFVGIVGASGSGKSSVARLIVGAARPTAGQVLIDGADRTRASPAVLALARNQVQMIFQDPHSALNPRRSVMRLLTQAYESAQAAPMLAARGREERAAELMRGIGLSRDMLGRYPSQLSGGQKQRVNIGRALCVMPRLIVADEIVSGLDVSIQAQILNLLLDLGREFNIALLLISHDLSVVRYLCSRVLVMQHGRVVEEGETARVFAAPAHPYTRELLSAIPPADASHDWHPGSDVSAA